MKSGATEPVRRGGGSKAFTSLPSLRSNGPRAGQPERPPVARRRLARAALRRQGGLPFKKSHPAAQQAARNGARGPGRRLWVATVFAAGIDRRVRPVESLDIRQPTPRASRAATDLPCSWRSPAPLTRPHLGHRGVMAARASRRLVRAAAGRHFVELGAQRIADHTWEKQSRFVLTPARRHGAVARPSLAHSSARTQHGPPPGTEQSPQPAIR